MQGYIFYPLQGISFGFSNGFPFYALLTNCSVCRIVPGVLIINHRLHDLLINPVFGAYLAVGTLVFPFDGKNIPFMMRFLLSLDFSVTRFIYQSARGVYYTNHPCSKSVWPSVPGFQHSI